MSFIQINRIVIVFAVIAFLLGSCSAKKKWEADKIKQQETALMEEAKKGKVDSLAVSKLLQAYETFAEKYPGDTIAANFLFKAADFYRYMQKPLKSIGIYEKIFDNYPDFEKRPYALFLQGFIYENEVGNIHNARLKYELFLKEFPQHPIAKDVEFTLKNLGKTPEQIMQEFEAAQKADATRSMSK
ncbi:MAG: tetratricopeptide repeat protein [Chitinophagales bacterium]|nr:tetratricopeptide repeat protein [Chitinophagales bacterium]